MLPVDSGRRFDVEGFSRLDKVTYYRFENQALFKHLNAATNYAHFSADVARNYEMFSLCRIFVYVA